MSYRAGVRGFRGIPDSDPKIVCDVAGCTAYKALPADSALAPAWFLADKPPPGWRGVRSYNGSVRVDLCPTCWRGPVEENKT